MFLQSLDILNKFLELEEPLIAENEEATLQLDDNVAIKIKAAPLGIWLVSKVALVPKQKEEFFLHAMRCNLFGEETGDAILGCDREGKMLLLLRFILDKTDEEEFLRVVEEFANYVDAWRVESLEFGEIG